LAKDLNIYRRRFQRQQFEAYRLGVLFLRTKGLGYWAIVQLLVDHWLTLRAYSLTHERPFAYELIWRRGVRSLKAPASASEA
jgi:hypothetical protein